MSAPNPPPTKPSAPAPFTLGGILVDCRQHGRGHQYTVEQTSAAGEKTTTTWPASKLRDKGADVLRMRLEFHKRFPAKPVPIDLLGDGQNRGDDRGGEVVDGGGGGDSGDEHQEAQGGGVGDGIDVVVQAQVAVDAPSNAQPPAQGATTESGAGYRSVTVETETPHPPRRSSDSLKDRLARLGIVAPSLSALPRLPQARMPPPAVATTPQPRPNNNGLTTPTTGVFRSSDYQTPASSLAAQQPPPHPPSSNFTTPLSTGGFTSDYHAAAPTSPPPSYRTAQAQPQQPSTPFTAPSTADHQIPSSLPSYLTAQGQQFQPKGNVESQSPSDLAAARRKASGAAPRDLATGVCAAGGGTSGRRGSGWAGTGGGFMTDRVSGARPEEEEEIRRCYDRMRLGAVRIWDFGEEGGGGNMAENEGRQMAEKKGEEKRWVDTLGPDMFMMNLPEEVVAELRPRKGDGKMGGT
ncbi:hypothetical protein NKR19_g4857 [Coniochaeta hoffmannii]|uniref:Uncharacterized protein n=1 Tax=Coniochaeta hoffmannii TaxID=91930 RepID=A0AA38VHP9_9PEZI|nr:hypothetical protein NKR19_g4857 [Coniochaeta hoffmannii]